MWVAGKWIVAKRPLFHFKRLRRSQMFIDLNVENDTEPVWGDTSKMPLLRISYVLLKAFL